MSCTPKSVASAAVADWTGRVPVRVSDQIVGLPELGLYGGERLALGLGQPQAAADYGRKAEHGRYQIVAVHAAVVGQHRVDLEG